MKKTYFKFTDICSTFFYYKITRYSCGHYSLEVLYLGITTIYPRLTRIQIEAVTGVSVKEVFNLHH